MQLQARACQLGVTEMGRKESVAGARSLYKNLDAMQCGDLI